MTTTETRTARETAGPHTGWVTVCELPDLLPERGAAALVDGIQVALFRLLDDQVHAIGNRDPFSGAHVLSRGIVGTRAGSPMVASPLHKQHFDLASGVCLEDGTVSVPVYDVRLSGTDVQVRLPPELPIHGGGDGGVGA